MATTAQLAAAKQAAANLAAALPVGITLTDSDLTALKDILAKLLPIVWPILLQLLLGILIPEPLPTPPEE